jgi:hypothetical protein
MIPEQYYRLGQYCQLVHVKESWEVQLETDP